MSLAPLCQAALARITQSGQQDSDVFTQAFSGRVESRRLRELVTHRCKGEGLHLPSLPETLIAGSLEPDRRVRGGAHDGLDR